jgi:hypothetical protein
MNDDSGRELGQEIASLTEQLRRGDEAREGMAELVADLTLVAREALGTASVWLAEAERRGYDDFAREVARVADRVVANFTAEDVAKLGDNIVLILNTVKDMTQPEIMGFVRNTVHHAEERADEPLDTTYRALLGQMRDPQVRRGMALTMRMLSTLGMQEMDTTMPTSAGAVPDPPQDGGA